MGNIKHNAKAERESDIIIIISKLYVYCTNE